MVSATHILITIYNHLKKKIQVSLCLASTWSECYFQIVQTGLGPYIFYRLFSENPDKSFVFFSIIRRKYELL